MARAFLNRVRWDHFRIFGKRRYSEEVSDRRGANDDAAELTQKLCQTLLVQVQLLMALVIF